MSKSDQIFFVNGCFKKKLKNVNKCPDYIVSSQHLKQIIYGVRITCFCDYLKVPIFASTYVDVRGCQSFNEFVAKISHDHFFVTENQIKLLIIVNLDNEQIQMI